MDCEATLTLREALLGGPGLDGYAFNAEILCVDCGQDAIRAVFNALAAKQNIGAETVSIDEEPFDQDTDTLPQPVFFGESDSAEHCGKCGCYCYGNDNEPKEE